MKLNEVFDSPSEWEQRSEFASERGYEKDMSYWSGDTFRFKVGGEEYSLSFRPGTDMDTFVQPTPKNLPKYFDYVQLTRTTKGAWDEGVSGTGNAVKVFATAMDIVKKHMKKREIPVVIGAKTSQPSRVKLYSRLLDKVATVKWKSSARREHEPSDEVLWLLPI